MGKKRIGLSRLRALSAQTTIDTTLYESSVDGSTQQVANFTVPTNTNLAIVSPGTSSLTASIPVASMANGQQLILANASGESFLLSASSGKILVGGSTTSSVGFPALQTSHFVKLDVVGSDANVLVSLMSGSIA